MPDTRPDLILLTLTAHALGDVPRGRVTIDVPTGRAKATEIQVFDGNMDPLDAPNGDKAIDALVIAAQAARDAYLAAL